MRPYLLPYTTRMRHLKFAAGFLLAAVLSGSGGTLAQRVAREVAAIGPKLVETRRDFHMHPELSNREERTARVIAARLKELGFDEIRTGVSRHGIVALLKGGKPGPVVAVRADMDALPIDDPSPAPYRSRNPGVKHACGHDVHMAVALGTAEVLSRMRAEVPGAVKFLFQPAEEGAPEGESSGAARMIAEGALENPRPAAIFGLHANPALEAGRIGYSPAAMLASSDTFTLRVTGRGVHAAWPHEGIDPIAVSAQVITALQTIASRRVDPVEPVVLTIGSIRGGNRSNIIAGAVEMQGTLRTHSEAVRERVLSLVKHIAEGVAAANGAVAEVRWSERSNPVTRNDTALVEATLPAMRRAIGAENVVLLAPVMGAEDFSYFQREIPGFFYWLGVRNQAKGITGALHTPEFDADEASLPVGVTVMTSVVLDFLERNARR